MKRIENEQFKDERALYGVDDLELDGCEFKGGKEEQRALMEASNIRANKCLFDLKYPFWRANNIKLNDVTMTEYCQAALWNTDNVFIEKSYLGGANALRVCENVKIKDSTVLSPRFGWKNKNVEITNTKIISEYAFLDSENIKADKINFQAKHGFQHVNELSINNSVLKAKYAFWYSKNVVVTDSLLEGEYLGWYSENLTLIRCHIRGTEPLCYCKNLKLIDCTMAETNGAFEMSEVDATVKGNIVSVKNPLKGKIVAQSITEVINDNSQASCKIEIITKE